MPRKDILLIPSQGQCLRTAGEKAPDLGIPISAECDLFINYDRSEVDDINLGLEHFYGDFNVVHTRLISSGVSWLSRMISLFRIKFI